MTSRADKIAERLARTPDRTPRQDALLANARAAKAASARTDRLDQDARNADERASR